MSKKSAEQLLAEFENGGRKGKTTEQASELLEVFGFVVSGEKSRNTAFAHLDLPSEQFVFGLEGDHLTASQYSDLRKACRKVLAEREKKKPVVVEREVTDTISLKEAPEIEVKFTYKTSWDAARIAEERAKVEIPLKEFVDAYNKVLEIWKDSYGIHILRDEEKKIVTISALDAVVQEGLYYGDRTKEQVKDWAEKMSAKVLEVYLERDARLEEFIKLGGHEVEGTGNTYKLTKTGKDKPFEVTYIAKGAIDQKSAIKIDEAITQKMEAKEKASKAISAAHAARKELPAESFVERVIKPKKVQSLPNLSEARQGLLDILLDITGTITKEQMYNVIQPTKEHVVFGLHPRRFPEFFDPTYDGVPNDVKSRDLTKLRSNFLGFLKENGATKAELKKAEADFKVVADSIPKYQKATFVRD